MKIACVYHRVDLDGWMSAAIVKHWFINNNSGVCIINDGVELPKLPDHLKNVDSINFIGYNHKEPIPDLSEYDKVIMCDISFPTDIMLELGRKLSMNFIYIDHHISAIIPIEEEIRNNNSFAISGIRDTKFAACELTWLNFFNSTPMPEIVRLLGRYDCFGHKGTDEEKSVLEFQYGARTCISNYNEALNYLNNELIRNEGNITVPTNTTWEYILNKGRAIYSYLCTEAKQIYNTKFDLIFEGNGIHNFNSNSSVFYPKFKFAAINRERFNPVNFGIDYHADGYDGVACWWYDDHKIRFSLYNDNGLVDCSAIAKQFDGGGHKGAAGFVLTTEHPFTLIDFIGVEEFIPILGSFQRTFPTL